MLHRPADRTCRRHMFSQFIPTVNRSFNTRDGHYSRCCSTWMAGCAMLALWLTPQSTSQTLSAAEKGTRTVEVRSAATSPRETERVQAEKPLSSADATIVTLKGGTSSKEARVKCMRQLPMSKFSKHERGQVEEILNELSLFRQLPTYEFEAHHDAYRYFSSYPDAAVSIWRVMQISQFEMWQTDKNAYEADAGDGTIGTIDVLYRSPTQNVILCQGEYKTPFLPKPITAKALIHLQTSFRKNESGQQLVRHRVDLFVSLPSQPVETAAKIISPLSNVIIDRNFHDISIFIHMMSLAMCKHPGWVEQTALRMEGVLPERRKELIDVTAKVYVDERRQTEITPVSAEKTAEPSTRQR